MAMVFRGNKHYMFSSGNIRIEIVEYRPVFSFPEYSFIIFDITTKRAIFFLKSFFSSEFIF